MSHITRLICLMLGCSTIASATPIDDLVASSKKLEKKAQNAMKVFLSDIRSKSSNIVAVPSPLPPSILPEKMPSKTMAKTATAHKSSATLCSATTGSSCQAGLMTGALSQSLPQISHQDTFIVVVSTSMGANNLKQLSASCKEAGCRLVMRGLLNNSFKTTQSYMLKHGIECDLNPPLVEDLKIRAVPTFAKLVYHNGTLMQARTVAGNITPSYAKELLVRPS